MTSMYGAGVGPGSPGMMTQRMDPQTAIMMSGTNMGPGGYWDTLPPTAGGQHHKRKRKTACGQLFRSKHGHKKGMCDDDDDHHFPDFERPPVGFFAPSYPSAPLHHPNQMMSTRFYDTGKAPLFWHEDSSSSSDEDCCAGFAEDLDVHPMRIYVWVTSIVVIVFSLVLMVTSWIAMAREDFQTFSALASESGYFSFWWLLLIFSMLALLSIILAGVSYYVGWKESKSVLHSLDIVQIILAATLIGLAVFVLFHRGRSSPDTIRAANVICQDPAIWGCEGVAPVNNSMSPIRVVDATTTAAMAPAVASTGGNAANATSTASTTSTTSSTTTTTSTTKGVVVGGTAWEPPRGHWPSAEAATTYLNDKHRFPSQAARCAHVSEICIPPPSFNAGTSCVCNGVGTLRPTSTTTTRTEDHFTRTTTTKTLTSVSESTTGVTRTTLTGGAQPASTEDPNSALTGIDSGPASLRALASRSTGQRARDEVGALDGVSWGPSGGLQEEAGVEPVPLEMLDGAGELAGRLLQEAETTTDASTTAAQTTTDASTTAAQTTTDAATTAEPTAAPTATGGLGAAAAYRLMPTGKTCAEKGLQDVRNSSECFGDARNNVSLSNDSRQLVLTFLQLACAYNPSQGFIFGDGSSGSVSSSNPDLQWVCRVNDSAPASPGPPSPEATPAPRPAPTPAPTPSPLTKRSPAPPPPKEEYHSVPPQWDGTNGAYCAAWEGSDVGWCYSNQGQRCSDGKVEPGGPYKRSSGPCTDAVESRSELVLAGEGALTAPLVSAILLAICLIAVAVGGLQIDWPVHEFMDMPTNEIRAPHMMDPTERRFLEAQEKARRKVKKETSNDMRLALFGYYRQAMEGDVRGARPNFFSSQDRAKYDYWAKNRGMSRKEAIDKYCELVDVMVE